MKDFWKKLITSGSGVSSKRFTGIICILFAMIYAVLGIILGTAGTVDGMVSTVIVEFLTAGVALFGVTAWERKERKRNNEE